MVADRRSELTGVVARELDDAEDHSELINVRKMTSSQS